MFKFHKFRIQIRRMGCEDSKMSTYNTPQSSIPVTVIDPGFLKAANESLRTSLQTQGVIVKTYMSVSCFISDQNDAYSSNILVRSKELEELLQGLKEINQHPRVFSLLQENQKDGFQTKFKDKAYDISVTFITYYEELLEKLSQKCQVRKLIPSKTFLDVKILKSRKGEGQNELFIFQQTLKVKGVNYRIYESVGQLEGELGQVESFMVVTDYGFHREVAALYARQKTKVVVYCKLEEEEAYHPSVSFFTNNFQQIVNQIVLLKAYKLPPLPTTKVFLCSADKNFFRYKQTLQCFNLKVRCSHSLKDILGVTKYYFSLIIICPQEEKTTIQNKICSLRVDFRVQVIGLMEETENTPIGLRKVLRQVKRGYLVEKGVCRLVDIIDKLHNDLKFQSVKEQLTKNNINYRCFNDFSSFAKNEVYCAPLIICNYHERHMLGKYLDKVQSRAKVIIYCNKQKINQHLLAQKRWAFVSSHFGKVINFIRNNKALIPIVLDHNQRRVELKQQKIKNKQHRISAVKWSDPSLAQFAENATKLQTLPEVSFIIPKLNTNPLEVKQISNDASALLKLSYEPPKNIDQFKRDLTVSLTFLKERYKLNFPQQAFNQLLDSIQSKGLEALAKRVRMFFGEEKQLGLKMNESLKKLDSIDEKELRHLKEMMYLMNLNFLSYYQMQPIGTIKLVHWTKETLLEQCLPEGVVIFKNFMVMYEEGVIDPIPGCLKLQLELEYNSLTDSNLPIVPYFCFEGRYVFAPYTQFKITGLSGQNQSAATLDLVKQPDFLGYYFQQNLSSNIPDYFSQNLHHEKTLVDEENRQKVWRRIERCSILRMYRTGMFEKAAKQQKALLAKEQQTQNIDSRALTELLYELANYEFKAGLIDDLLNTLTEVMNSNPSPLIKKDCAVLLAKAKTEIGKENIVRNPLELKSRKEKTIKCIELKETIEKIEDEQKSESSQEEAHGMENNLLEYEKCLEIDDGDFQYFQ